MNANPLRRVLLLTLLSLAAMLLVADPVSAAEAASSMLQANLVWEFVGNRSRMIQISLVFVLVGCAMLWWRR